MLSSRKSFCLISSDGAGLLRSELASDGVGTDDGPGHGSPTPAGDPEVSDDLQLCGRNRVVQVTFLYPHASGDWKEASRVQYWPCL